MLSRFFRKLSLAAWIMLAVGLVVGLGAGIPLWRTVMPDRTSSEDRPPLVLAAPGNETDSQIYSVVVDKDSQYSIWPEDRTAPAGWSDAGVHGTRQACLSWILDKWTAVKLEGLSSTPVADSVLNGGSAVSDIAVAGGDALPGNSIGIPPVVEVNSRNFQSYVLQSDKPVVVHFWAPWESRSRMFAPVFQLAAEKSDGSVKFGKLNVDENPEIAKEYNIFTVPMCIIFKNGKVADTWPATMNLEVLEDFINMRK
jgi:thioredoxin 1